MIHAKTGRFVERLLLASVPLLTASGCDPFGTGFEELEEARYYRSSREPEQPPLDGPLRVMNYNLKFGGGRIDFFFDCHGDRVLMARSEVSENLAGLARKINDYDPDLLIVQEVDVNSKRSAFVDEMQWLLEHTALDHGVYASQWKADFVPSDGLGAVDSGNGVLSKYPLEDAERIALSLRSDQSGIERYFYLKRNLLRARLRLPEREPVYVVATHAEAYAEDGTKRQHIERFRAELDRLDGEGHTVIGAGDLNTLPPGSDVQSDFPDSACTEEYVADDYRAESDWLSPLYERYQPEIPLADYRADNTRYFTHTTDANGFYNRKLDYIFTNARVVEGSGLVHQSQASGGMETMPLSDHAPVSVELELL